MTQRNNEEIDKERNKDLRKARPGTQNIKELEIYALGLEEKEKVSKLDGLSATRHSTTTLSGPDNLNHCMRTYM